MTIEPHDDNPRSDKDREFEQCANQAQASLVREFFDFLIHNKKWWLTPIILVLLFVGLLIVLGGTGAAPFIYTLF